MAGGRRPGHGARQGVRVTGVAVALGHLVQRTQPGP
jgi:hypothetical protein